jgi:uncharacterized membrane protein YdbT with pleckstrin-like domain
VSYIQNSLIKGEQVVLQARISWWSQLPLIVLGFLLLPAMGFGLLLWVIAAARYFTTEMAITNKRVIAKFGFISRRTVEINLQRIESIQVHQSIFGRVFNYGSIIVSGAGNPQAPIPGISDPLRFRKEFSGRGPDGPLCACPVEISCAMSQFSVE